MRFLLRLLGYGFLAAGFALAVIDGIRMVAGGPIEFMALRRLWALVNFRSLAAWEETVKALGIEWLWPSLLGPMLDAPAALYGLVPGLFLVWLGLKREPKIGVASWR